MSDDAKSTVIINDAIEDCGGCSVAEAARWLTSAGIRISPRTLSVWFYANLADDDAIAPLIAGKRVVARARLPELREMLANRQVRSKKAAQK